MPKICILLRKQAQRAWHSPTFTGWARSINRTGSFVFVMPLLLTRFSTAELALFFLLQSFSSLLGVLDFGFGPTFSRFISYGRGGRSIEELSDLSRVSLSIEGSKVNWSTIEHVVRAMHFVYRRLAIIVVILAGTVGPLLLARSISLTEDPFQGWLACGVVAVSSARIVYRRFFSSFLEGMNYTAMLNRWDTFMGALGILSSAIVLLAGGKLLAVIISVQIWEFLRASTICKLARNVENGWLAQLAYQYPDQRVFTLIWSKAWRSGIGTVIVTGFSRSFGLLLAQFMAPATIAGYLFASRIIGALTNLSISGFNPKLPKMAVLRASGNIDRLATSARRNITIANWAFVLPVCLLGIAGPGMFALIGSKMAFPPLLLWALLAMKEQLQRISVMHMHLYQLTNHIVSHKVSAVLAFGQIVACYSLFPWLGVYAMPMGSIIGAIFPLIWLSRLSYASLNTSFLKFEPKASAAPVFALIVLVVIGYEGSL